ncbi:hypothetical protein [Chitinophaga jiangningensis]|nr:hypothetical protein [Chitinophaga jiangningensis]
MKKLWILAGGICLYAMACKNEQAPAPQVKTACDTAKIFTSYAVAVIQANCTSRGCHPGGNAPAAANFSTAQGIKAYITARPNIFAERVTGPQADMPPAAFKALSQGTKDSLACWVNHGMPDQ